MAPGAIGKSPIPGSSSPGAAPAVGGYLPHPSGTGVRVAGTRGGRAEVGRAQVVVADQPELALVGLVRIHAPIAGRLADGPAQVRARPAFGRSCLRERDVLVFIFGPHVLVMPGRVLAHDFPPLPAANRADCLRSRR